MAHLVITAEAQRQLHELPIAIQAHRESPCAAGKVADCERREGFVR